MGPLILAILRHCLLFLLFGSLLLESLDWLLGCCVRAVLVEILPQGIDALCDHILVSFDLNIAEWASDSITDLRLCILLVSIALRIPQEVQLDKLVLRAGVHLVDYSQVPFTKVILRVYNEALSNLVLFDCLLQPDV